MNRLDKARQMTNDFMQGHGKANEKDMLTRQKPGHRKGLNDEDISNLYATNAMVQNIVNIPAEDMTRAWFTLRMKDDKLRGDIMSRLQDLNARETIKKMRQFERLRGDGFISLGVSQTFPNTINLEKELKPEMVKRIDYLHAFSSQKVTDFLTNEDVFSPKFGQVDSFKIRRRRASGILVPEKDETIVHSSRIIHDQTRRLEDDERGQSLLEPIYDVVKVLDTALWSVGQILYDFTFKTYKAEGIEDMSKADKQELSMLMDFMFRTEALAIIGTNESLTKESSSVSGIHELLDFVWDYVAGVTRMPKTVIKGQEAGTITGAQYDVMNYYARIAAHQETELKPHLERLVRLLLWAEDEPGGKIDPDSFEWEIAFNPLWSVDSETDAKIRKMNAETDQIYIVNGVHTADEIKESRFGQFGYAEQLKVSGDSADFEELANEVYGAWKEGGTNG